MTDKSPLGVASEYPQTYAPEQLFAIARAESRATVGLGNDLPFHGTDIWTAWELTWLDANGLPQVAIAEIRVPAESPNIVESKSLKLYLNSFAMTHFESLQAVTRTLCADIGTCIGSPVDVRLDRPQTMAGKKTGILDGDCLDDRPLHCDSWEVDAGFLVADIDTEVSESLHSHLLRSLCPVTHQPDSGSVLISYRGPRIDRDGLLRYIVSYRQHADFHECCVERMFLDIMARCAPTELTVHARYQRRGGIDINPVRSSVETAAEIPRLWQQ